MPSDPYSALKSQYDELFRIFSDNEFYDFSELKRLCEKYYKKACVEEVVDDDSEHYIFEEAMMAFYGRDVFEKIAKAYDESQTIIHSEKCRCRECRNK